MTAPTLTASYVVADWNLTTGTQTATVTTAAGDKLAVLAVTEDSAVTCNTPTGNGLTYTLARSSTVSGTTSVYGWTATDAVGGTSWTMTITRAAGSGRFGFVVLRFSGSSGFDSDNAGANGTASAPSLSLTTTNPNSAVCWASGDWFASDGAGRTWLTVNGITPTAGNGDEKVYYRNNLVYTVYAGYWPDAGAAGANTYGLSAPSAQGWGAVVIGVKGTGSAAPPPQQQPGVYPSAAVVRSAVW